MEKKMVKVNFEVELAKKITNGDVEGRIIDNDGNHYRIVCFDLADDKGKIIGLRKNNNYTETALTFNDNGYCVQHPSRNLMLKIPEYMTFKDGDVIAYDGFDTISITMADVIRNVNDVFAHYYAELRNGKLHFYEEGVRDVLNVGSRLATESEKQKLIDALKASKEPKAKEYLKLFFGIEVKQEYVLNFRDMVLVRASKKDKWCAAEFSHIESDGWYAVFGGIYYKYCIPYNEQTAHLLGTTEDYKGD